jgi:hypothetical protein
VISRRCRPLLEPLGRGYHELQQGVCSLVGNLTKAEWRELASGLTYRTTCPN